MQGNVALDWSVPSANDGDRAAVGDCGQCQAVEHRTIGQAGDSLRGNRANMVCEGITSVEDVVGPEGTYACLVGA